MGSVLLIHRQVRKYIQSRLDNESLQQGFEWAVDLLNQKFPRQSSLAEPMSGLWAQCELWIAHLISLNTNAVSLGERLFFPEALASLLVNGAIYLWERGLLEQGKILILAAKAFVETQTSNPLLRSEVYSFYACILSELGNMDQAMYYFSEQVKSRRENLRSLQRRGQQATMLDEVQLANAYNNVAGILCAKGNHGEAELNNILSLRLKERWMHKHDLKYLLALSYSNLANVHGRQQNWDQAAQFYEKAIEFSEGVEDTTRRALTFHNFGCMRLAQGAIIPAQELLTEAFQLRSEKLGDHHDTAATLHMLAQCHYRLEKLLDARLKLSLNLIFWSY